MTATILIVENHAPLRLALRWWLENNFPRYQVIEAADEVEAMALVQAGSPQMIVMDVGSPGINDLASTRRIKTMAPTIPIVVLTSYDSEAHRLSATAAGASACVSKGSIQTELQLTLARLLFS